LPVEADDAPDLEVRGPEVVAGLRVPDARALQILARDDSAVALRRLVDLDRVVAEVERDDERARRIDRVPRDRARPDAQDVVHPLDQLRLAATTLALSDESNCLLKPSSGARFRS